MKKGWKIFWTVIISLTGAGVVFCIIALCLGVTFSQFEKAYPNGIGIIRKNYVSFEEDWDDDDDDEPEETENVVSGETFSNVENLKLDIGASEVQIKTGTDDKIHVDDSRMKTEDAVQKRLSDDRKTLEITTKMRSSFDFKNVRNVKGTLVIYLPRDYKFDQVDMEYGAVTAEIDGLNAKSLKIESGASGCTIKNADIEELDVETGAGSLDFYGTVEKEVDIDCGAGSVTLNLEGKVEDYNYELDSSAGSVEIGEDIDLGGLSTEKSIDNGRNARLRYRTEQAAWRSVSIRINIDRKMYQMKHIYNRRNTKIGETFRRNFYGTEKIIQIRNKP